MRTHGLWWAASIASVIVGTASVAVGGTDEKGTPLIVAVEVSPGGGADVRQVREVIGRELGRPIVPFIDGAAESAGTDASDLLLVGLSRERIVMSLRRRFEVTVARSLPAPSDGPGRLRAIAWLAGNVVRDQISPFLRASSGLGGGGLAVAEPARAAPAPAAPAPEPPAVPATSPPPLQPPPLTAVDTVRFQASASPERAGAPWSVTTAGGLSLWGDAPLSRYVGTLPLTFQAELVNHRPSGWLWGAGLDVGTNGHIQGGLAVLSGFEHRWGKLRLDATAGLGLERTSGGSNVTTVTSESPPMSETTVTVRGGTVPFGRAFATLSHDLTPTWGLLFRLGVNVPLAGQAFGGPVVMAALGVRFNLR